MASPQQALCVIVRWGRQRLATHLLPAGSGRALRLGPGAEVELPPARAVTFRAAPDGFVLEFADGVTGSLLRDAEAPLRLGDAVQRGLAMEQGPSWRLRLGHRDAVVLEAGALVVEAFSTRRPLRALARLDDVLDYRWLNTLLVVALLAAVGLTQLSFAEAPSDDGPSARQLAQVRRVLVRAAEPPPARGGAASPVPAKRRQPRRGEEGRPRPEVAPPREASGAPQSPTALVRQLFAGPGLSAVLGAGGLGRELSGAMGRLVGASQGLGGLVLRGSGEGGGPGGELQGLGRLATRGVAQGVGELCRPPRQCKAQPVPEVEVGDSVACAPAGQGRGCLDKELIRRVIRAHLSQVRYCYQLALQEQPGLAGKIAVSFAVGAQGAVTAAEIASATARSETLEGCLLSRVRQWRFPVEKGQLGYRVTYPFVFKPTDG